MQSKNLQLLGIRMVREMSSRRNRPENRWGCKPEEDVCVGHDESLLCKHGCVHVKEHECKELRENPQALHKYEEEIQRRTLMALQEKAREERNTNSSTGA